LHDQKEANLTLLAEPGTLVVVAMIFPFSG